MRCAASILSCTLPVVSGSISMLLLNYIVSQDSKRRTVGDPAPRATLQESLPGSAKKQPPSPRQKFESLPSENRTRDTQESKRALSASSCDWAINPHLGSGTPFERNAKQEDKAAKMLSSPSKLA
eukprot:470033-Amphidinium_carterae.1